MVAFFGRFLKLRAQSDEKTVDATLAAAGAALTSHDLVRAAQLFQRVTEIDSSRSDAFYQLGNVQKDLGLLQQSLASYEGAIRQNPHFSRACCNRGVVLHRLGRLDDALTSLSQAIELDPKDAISYYNRALVLQDCALWREASASYSRAIELKPSFADAQYNRALLLLSLGDFRNGWRAFEWRWQLADRLLIGERRSFDKPLWLGEQPLAGQRLLLHSEGGLGDTIQFSRYAALCAAHGAHVILQAQPALLPLLRTVPGVRDTVAMNDTPPPFDLHCPLMSLPLAFCATSDIPPYSSGFLSTDSSHGATWSARLGPRHRPRVGLVWSGNRKNWIDQQRSIRLREWLPFLPLQLDYYCLQTDVREEDAAVLSASRIQQFDAAELDFASTGALCEHLDLILSVDTSLVHLAGALGCPVWLLLPTPADWRWGHQRLDTPWYSSAKLYRQHPAQGWANLLSQVSRDLLTHFQVH